MTNIKTTTITIILITITGIINRITNMGTTRTARTTSNTATTLTTKTTSRIIMVEIRIMAKKILEERLILKSVATEAASVTAMMIKSLRAN